jgi:hypothetical protein
VALEEEPLSDQPKQTRDQVAASGKEARRPPEGKDGARIAPDPIREKASAAETGTSASAGPADKAIPVDRLNASNDD